MSRENDPFERIEAFEWDEEKRKSNFAKHNIDFDDVSEAFGYELIYERSDRFDEARYLVLATLEGNVIAIACTIRNNCCRLISARRASTNEREKYHKSLTRHATKRAD
jgi:uncharacterized DUF497 family protein